MGFQHFFCIPGWFFIGAIFLVKLLLQVHDYNKETLLYSRGWSRLIIRGAIDADYCQECCLCANDVSIVPHRVFFCLTGPIGEHNVVRK